MFCKVLLTLKEGQFSLRDRKQGELDEQPAFCLKKTSRGSGAGRGNASKPSRIAELSNGAESPEKPRIVMTEYSTVESYEEN